jgi:thiosulfate/3-mercaptopyruvate sulfurtransferase
VKLPRPLVSALWLKEHLSQPDLVLADCRFITAGDPEAGRRAYAQEHLPGAVYFHLDEDLSAPIGEHGGRHPLPDPAVIAARLGQAGIGEGTQVVAYDWTGEHAARFWFVLRWLGHDAVAVLDGGWHGWVRAGCPVESEAPRPAARLFTPRLRPELVATAEEVRGRPPGVVVLDGRAAERYQGQPHPLDAKQGHIPGARNRPWQSSLGPDGCYLPPEQQAAGFAGLPEGPALIHCCGSGVTSCVNLMAAELAGRRGNRLYVGGWSDWCTYPENPVER